MTLDGRSAPRLGGRQWATVWRLLQSGDLTALVRRTIAFLSRLGNRPTPVNYGEWRRKWVELDESTRARVDHLVAGLTHPPSFTVLLPIDDADAEMVAATVGSLTGQRYANWGLCLTGVGSPKSTVVSAVTAASDPRVRFTGLAPGPIGEWVARLAPGDLLHEAALFMVANAIDRNPSAAVVYTDHEHVGPDGRFADPHMKPDWNPDLLAGMDYFAVLTAYRADLWMTHVDEATGTHDVAVRATISLESDQVVHIPKVLAALRVVGDNSHLVPATVRVTHPLPDPPPRVSVLIPTRDQGRMLKRCLSSLREITDYPDMELVIVDHETSEVRARAVLDSLAAEANIRIISFSGPFNFAAMVNRAADAATGKILVLLNNDTEIIEEGWLSELVAQVSRPEVGIAGALLTFANETIQHAGVHPGMAGLMGHGHKHLPANHPGYFGRLLVAHEVAAVTGACLAIETLTWKHLGGLDEEQLAVAYNDVDLCLRARAAGLRVIFTPHARMVHHESVSRGVDIDPTGNKRLGREKSVMVERWDKMLYADPAYSPNLALDGGGFALAVSPRGERPWLKSG